MFITGTLEFCSNVLPLRPKLMKSPHLQNGWLSGTGGGASGRSQTALKASHQDHTHSHSHLMGQCKTHGINFKSQGSESHVLRG